MTIKKLFSLLFITTFFLSMSACEDESPFGGGNNSDNEDLSEQEVTQGLKEALKTGTKRAVDTLNRVNGYFRDEAVKIFFPPDAQKVEEKLREAQFGFLVDEFIKKLNRAAEDAAEEATPIFVDAVANMSFQDARNILQGSDSAATQYFRQNTSKALFDAFKPDIENSLDEVGAQSAWNDVTTKYNQITLGESVETDLAKYTTNEALEGLFLKLKKEEEQIRLDPAARTKEILEKVFSTLDDN